MKNKINKAGGKRSGAGREKKYINPGNIMFYAEQDKIEKAKKLYPRYLKNEDGSREENPNSLNNKFNTWLLKITTVALLSLFLSGCAVEKDCYNSKYSPIPKHKFRN